MREGWDAVEPLLVAGCSYCNHVYVKGFTHLAHSKNSILNKDLLAHRSHAPTPSHMCI